MTDITIQGKPVAVFTFFDLPSWNGLVGLHRMKYGSISKGLRGLGESMAEEFQRTPFIKFLKLSGQEYFIERKIMLLIKIYTPSENILDIPNISTKAICDGFSDAKLWPDDEWAYIPLAIFMWAGIDVDPQSTYLKKYVTRKSRNMYNRSQRQVTRTVLEVHSIGTFTINNERVKLPLGRTKT